MGIFRNIYNDIDRRLGGRLPGGVPRTQPDKINLGSPDDKGVEPETTAPIQRPTGNTQTPAPSFPSSSGGGSSNRNKNYYYNIDDPTQQYTRETGQTEFKELDGYVENPQSIAPNVSQVSSAGSGGSRSTGLFLINPGEEQSSQIPSWTVQSKNPYENVAEGFYASQVNLSTPLKTPLGINAPLTTEQILQDRTQINFAQKLFKSNLSGEILTPDRYDNLYKESVLGAYSDFEGLNRYTKTKAGLSSIGVAGATIGVGFVEFGGTAFKNFGMEGFKKGEKVNPFKIDTFELPGTSNLKLAGYAPTTAGFFESPKTYLSQKSKIAGFNFKGIVIAGITGTAVKSFTTNISKLGVRTGTAETLSYFSPFRLSTRIYTPQVTGRTANINIARFGNKGGLGSGATAEGDVFYTARINPSGSRGGGSTNIRTTSQFIDIRGGGGVIETGSRNVYIKEISLPSPRGVGKLGTRGLIGGGFSKPYISGTSTLSRSRIVSDVYTYSNGIKFNLYGKPTAYQFTTGSISRDFGNGISKYSSGLTKPLYKTSFTNRGYVYEPSGRYRLSPKISGTDVQFGNIGNFQGTQSGGGARFNIKSGGNIKNIVSSKGGLKQFINTRPTLKTGRSSEFNRAKITLAIETPALKTTQAVRTSAVSISALASTYKFASPQRTRQYSILAPGIQSGFKNIQRQFSGQTQIITSGSISKSRSTYGLGLISGGLALGFGIPRPTGTGFPFGLPNLSGFSGGIKDSTFKGGKRKTQYTPSFSALLGFKGKSASKALAKSGLNYRPVKAGFGIKTTGGFLG